MVFLVAVFTILFLTKRSRFFNIYWLAFILLALILSFLDLTFFAPQEDSKLYSFSLSIFIFAFLPLVLLTLSVVTFFNSKILMEKEGRRVRNLFISLIGIASLVILLFSVYQYMNNFHSSALEFFYYYIVALFIYFLGLFTASAIYTCVYLATPFLFEPQYIIVLGSGLIGDRVPPLLASRLDKAVQQYRKYGERALFITSGGQGSDELLSEAVAMKKYIIDKYDIAPEKIIVEDQSTTTYENMLFSKKMIDAHVKNAKGIFVTNNFHVYRASIYAEKVGLKAVGVGSKTAMYYLPNAFMREFIGLLEITKWYHVIILGLSTIIWAIVMNGYL
ncbi:YdcF family protein [Solibacillus sp. FSL R7-0668]|uniref:YdcF family protein n=1 Tax=Solibacillus sp. FSL R7-0668 TaxID=2921688 RepID=UPI0030F8C472